MPNPRNILQTLQSDLKKKTTISYLNVKPGDTLARVADGTVALFTLASRIGDKASTVEGGSLFLSGNNVKLYLIDRPKPPLPAEAGARIVAWRVGELDDPQGIILEHDGSKDYDCWSDMDGGYWGRDDIHEWAPLPDNFFDELRKGANK